MVVCNVGGDCSEVDLNGVFVDALLVCVCHSGDDRSVARASASGAFTSPCMKDGARVPCDCAYLCSDVMLRIFLLSSTAFCRYGLVVCMDRNDVKKYCSKYPRLRLGGRDVTTHSYGDCLQQILCKIL